MLFRSCARAGDDAGPGGADSLMDRRAVGSRTVPGGAARRFLPLDLPEPVPQVAVQQEQIQPVSLSGLSIILQGAFASVPMGASSTRWETVVSTTAGSARIFRWPRPTVV